LDSLIAALGLQPTLDLLSFSPPGWGGNLLDGLINSIKIAVGAFGLGLLIGTLGAYGKLYGGPVVKDLLAVYTTIVRAVPELILILILYYAATNALNQALVNAGFERIQISGLVAGIGVLGVVQGAYATEVLRGAILAVPPGQIEAARAMGMPPLMLARRITLPEMLGFATPGLANLWLIATKDTALLAVVGFAELTLETRQAAGSTKAYFTFFFAAGILYLAITLLSTRLFGRIERWARRGEPQGLAGGR
jgi:polar amino acid transport system permease protein